MTGMEEESVEETLVLHTTEVLSETLKQEDISWLSSGIILSY